MAKAIFSVHEPYYGGISDQLSNSDLERTVSRAKTATFVDHVNGSALKLFGTRFTYDDESGHMLSGKVKKIVVIDDNHDTYLTVSGKYRARDLVDALINSGGEGFEDFIFAGNDKVKASKYSGGHIDAGDGDDVVIGNKYLDSIVGGNGNDRLTGKGGPDVFYFIDGFGRDVITDFDANGLGNDQDYFRGLDYNSVVSKSEKNGNTILDFGDGDRIKLLDVKAADITVEDFFAPF